MTLITFQDGQVVFRDGAVGTEQSCCCNKCSGPCDGENPCPEGCVCVDGECVEGTEVCFIFEALDPSCQNACYWCTREESIAASQAAANEGGCSQNLFPDPDCVFKFANGDPPNDPLVGLVNPDTGDPECPEWWAQIVTCCYTCPNPLP